MPWYPFAIRLIVALLLGALVGAERQWRQSTAGLPTNCLVAKGSAMFVMMGGLIGGDSSQGRVAWYAVNGMVRPLGRQIHGTPVQAPEEIVLYLSKCVCRTTDEVQIRALLLQNIKRTPLALYAHHSEDEEGASRVKVRAQVSLTGGQDEFPEQILTRLSLEPSVTTVRWKIAAALDVGEDRIVGAGPDSFDKSQASLKAKESGM